jgi:hypothetical protein
MKSWIIGGIMLMVGAAAGWFAAQAFWLRTFQAAIPPAIRSIEEKQQYACLISLAVLGRLESNETDKAKALLVREVASYYRQAPTSADSPERKQVLAFIEDVRKRSSILNEELLKKP